MNHYRSLWCAAVVLCVLVAPCLWAQSDQPSLADVARQKSAAKAKRVVTNDEIPPSPDANNVPASSRSASGDSGKSGAAKKDAPKSDLPADKQTRMQELMKDHDDLQKVLKQLEEKIAATTDSSLISTLGPILQHARDALAKNEAETDKLKAGVAAGSQSGSAQVAAGATPATGK